MITKFNSFINEGIRDKMIPKDKDEVLNLFKNKTKKEKVHIIAKDQLGSIIDDLEEVRDLKKDLENREIHQVSFREIVHKTIHKDDEDDIRQACKRLYIDYDDEQLKEIRKRMEELENLYEKLKDTTNIDIHYPEPFDGDGESFYEYSFHIAKNGKHYGVGMSMNFETDFEEQFCSIWYYLDDMKSYHNVKPDTIEELEKMIKTTIIK